MTLFLWEYQHYKIALVFGLALGLGVLYMPQICQAGIVIGPFSLVVTWYPEEEDDSIDVSDLYPARS